MQPPDAVHARPGRGGGKIALISGCELLENIQSAPESSGVSIGQDETEEGVRLYLQQCIRSRYTLKEGRFEKTQSAEALQAFGGVAENEDTP